MRPTPSGGTHPQPALPLPESTLPLPDSAAKTDVTLSRTSSEAKTDFRLSRTSSEAKTDSRTRQLAFPTTPQEHTRTALVVEEMPRMTPVLNENGWHTVTYHPRSLSSTYTQAENKDIHSGKYQLVCCEVPAGGHSVPPNKLSPILREIALWVRTAKTAPECIAVLNGPRSRTWQNPDIHGLLEDGIITEHRYSSCRLELHDPEDPTKWSPLEIHVYSTVPLQGARCKDWTTCNHAPWNNARSGRMGAKLYRDQLMNKCYNAFVPKLLDDLAHHWKCGTKPNCGVRDSSGQIGVEEPSASAFPTEARLRAKEKEKAGHKATKQKIHVEEHFDDLGDDLTGLGKDIGRFMNDVSPSISARHKPHEQQQARIANHLVRCCCHGTGNLPHTPGNVYMASTLTEVSRHMEDDTGPCVWDISCNPDCVLAISAHRVNHEGVLKSTQTSTQVRNEHEGTKVIDALCKTPADIVLMTCATHPNTTPTHSAMEYVWYLFRNLAMHQMAKKRAFIFLQRLTPRTWEHTSMDEIARYPGVASCRRNNCLMLTSSQRTGTPIRRTMRMGTSPTTNGLQWTWPVVESLAQSAAEHLYPEVAAGPEGDSDDEPLARVRDRMREEAARREEAPGEPVPERKWRNCPGCRGRMARTRREHTRIRGECKFPDIAPEPEWTCPGCARNPPRDRGHADHNEVPGQCRWAAIGHRASSRRTRHEKHPREGRIPAAHDPNADLRGNELNRGAEAQNEPGRSSSDPAPPGAGVGPLNEDPPGAGREPGVGRGPDREPRHREPAIVLRDQASGGPGREEWTSFDVNHSLRVLRTSEGATLRREIRKLHLRWWHATRSQMERVLQAAGVPREAIDCIPDVIDTCKECRAWQKHRPEVKPSIELVTKQNEQVEADILFYKDHMIWHMVDRADRWHAATPLPAKTAGDLCEAISRCWIRAFGPFKTLVIDGEKGITAEEAK